MTSPRTNRRQFLKQAAAGAAGVTAAATLRANAEPDRGVASKPTTAPAAAGDKIVMGMIGTGGRGTWLLEQELTKRPNLRIAYLCDVDRRRLDNAVALVEKVTGRRPVAVSDFRRILDDPAVHAVFNTTPDHWHALLTIYACQAGKDVYVEKPASHSLWEGRKMVEAARKYNRVVQLGTQTRSGAYTHQAVEFLRAGKIGDIHLVRVFNMKCNPPVEPKPDGPPPEGLDYDAWLGPAPQRPFNPARCPVGWNWFWDYSGGDIINDGVHQIDAARMLVGRQWPKAVFSTGGKLAYNDAKETPDTQIVTWEFDNDLIMTFELTLWTPHMYKMPWEIRDTDEFPDWPFNATKVEVHGTKGMMLFERHGGGWQAWNPDHKEIASANGRHPHVAHLDNFFDCVMTRKRPNADIEEGHLSTALCHLGNISYRVGCRRLLYDGRQEQFVNDPQANALLKRAYRAPWVVPETV